MSLYPASIDDNDPQVIYSGGWILVTSDAGWTGTEHSSSVFGSTASVRFTGSRVAVICTIPTGGGSQSIASFSIDGSQPVQVGVVTTPPVQYNYEFWNSGPLPLASHLLVINNTGTQAYFRLDRIDYDPTASNAPSSSTPSATTAVPISNSAPASSSTTTATLNVNSSFSASSTSLSGSASSASSIFSVSSGSSSATTSSLSSIYKPTSVPEAANTPVTGSHTSNHSIPIVAGVLGAILALVLLIALVILCRRRKKVAIYSEPPDPLDSSDATTPRPFTFSSYSNNVSRGNSTMRRPMTLNTYTDNTSTAPASVSLGLSYLDQTDDGFSSSGYESSSVPPMAHSDYRTPLISQDARHQFPPEKWQGGPSRSFGPSNRTSDSPPAYPGFS